MVKKKKKKKRGGKATTARTGRAAAGRKPSPRAGARRGKKASSKKPVARKTRKTGAPKRARPRPRTSLPPRSTRRGLGPEAGGQSGDTEGLSRRQLADSESVEELLEEGQAFEAGIVSGVENAPDPSQGRGRGRGEVRTRQVPEDDVPQEYLDED